MTEMRRVVGVRMRQAKQNNSFLIITIRIQSRQSGSHFVTSCGCILGRSSITGTDIIIQVTLVKISTLCVIFGNRVMIVITLIINKLYSGHW